MQNNLNDPQLVLLQMLQLRWLKFVIIAIYFLPFVGIWALGGRISSDAYDDLVSQGCVVAVSILRDLQFIMNPVMQPVVSVQLLLLARGSLDNNEAEP
ncbi:hypothetical protein DVH05_019389 [Phytophthora capsici]|nr:hypothetical protein DVH05_019389 [Phytophthora capsici]